MMAGGYLSGYDYWQPAYNTTYDGSGSGNYMLTFPEDPFIETQDWTKGFSIYFKMYSQGSNHTRRVLSYRLSEGGTTHYPNFWRNNNNATIEFDYCGYIAIENPILKNKLIINHQILLKKG